MTKGRSRNTLRSRHWWSGCWRCPRLRSGMVSIFDSPSEAQRRHHHHRLHLHYKGHYHYLAEPFTISQFSHSFPPFFFNCKSQLFRFSSSCFSFFPSPATSFVFSLFSGSSLIFFFLFVHHCYCFLLFSSVKWFRRHSKLRLSKD